MTYNPQEYKSILSKRRLILSQTGQEGNQNGGQEDDESEDTVQTLKITITRIKKPPLYQVIMLNDDYTPMDFVIACLETIFVKPHEEALSIMLDVHQKGAAVCGIYPHAVAETKAYLVMEQAKKEQHPLRCRLQAN